MATPNTDEQEITQPLLERSISAEDPHSAKRQTDAQPLREAAASRLEDYDAEVAQGPIASGNSAEEIPLHALPRASSKWRAQRALMAAWLLSSIATFLPSIFFPFLWTLGGMAGIFGSCWYFCHCWGLKPARDIASNVQVIWILGIATGCFSGLMAIVLGMAWVGSLLCLLVDGVQGGCGAASILLLFPVSWFLMHAALSIHIARKARKIKRLLNPFSSGVVS
ncbi:hypothetical protein WJX74_001968 [Apatococcus lobatus]|uniref:Uncharacterized protein n=1 Tax=Apatococcus lobatus TaxID=904363 RepID=A0AAW1S1M6_9CHLO